MDYLTCPACNEAPLMKNEHGRACVNCGHEMNEIEYHIFAAAAMARLNQEMDALEKKTSRTTRTNFGKKQTPRVKKV